MKRRAESNRRSSAKRDEVSNLYLKPGALAQLRNSKITAKSQRPISQSLIFLHQLAAAASSENSNGQVHPSDGVPCFGLRTGRPQCPQRKKLFAAVPFFTENQS